MELYSLELKRKEKCCKQGHNGINEFIELDLKSPIECNSAQGEEEKSVCVHATCTHTSIKQCAFGAGEIMAHG